MIIHTWKGRSKLDQDPFDFTTLTQLADTDRSYFYNQVFRLISRIGTSDYYYGNNYKDFGGSVVVFTLLLEDLNPDLQKGLKIDATERYGADRVGGYKNTL